MRRIAMITFLFAAPAAIAAAEVLPDALEAGWQGKKVCELLQEDEMMRVLRCTFPPGIGHETHYHPAHFGYTLSEGGTMQVTDASGTREIMGSAGGTWLSEGVPWHHAINIGETTMQYLIVEQKN